MNLELKNVTKSYGDQQVLHDLSLALTDVHAVGVIGESGCGKSTLLRQIAGLEQPEMGEIWVDGQSPITDKGAFQRKIGVVFQRHHLFPHLSLKENISLILRKTQQFSRQDGDARAMELLQKLRIGEEADKKPSQVSGGQGQRCAIARALATNPQYLFLDEPTAALDPLLTGEVLDAVRALKDEGIDFFFVTHELGFLREFADCYIFMRDGRIVEWGDIACIDAFPSPELAQFLSHE